jgi:uncharacterized repeat protein (TIGR03833 family)
MSRNSASGANKQRRKPQRQESDRGGPRRYKAQPGHTDPNLRLDGQLLEQSFTHLEKTKEPTRVVGLEGWKDTNIKGNENKQEKDKPSIHDDVWDYFWNDSAITPTGITPTAAVSASATCTSNQPLPKERLRSAEPSIRGRTATPELPKYHPSIPKLTAVTVGKSADIVLKQDQGTGRTVKGVISEILTRGDHPWGIKVRLIDGRVGRVQRIY